MADEEKPGIPPEATDVPTPEDAESDTGGSDIRPAMSEQEIRDAGLAVDVPFESGVAQPERLKYADLGADKKYEGAEPSSDQVTGGDLKPEKAPPEEG